MATIKKVTKTKKTVKSAKKSVEIIAEKKPTGLATPVIGVDGKAVGHVTLPEKLFGVKVNKAILAQAIRVYLANQREGSASTKTRGEVEGSTRKIYKQKGTGRARHGGIRAPIFVGGGITFGPKPHSFALDMSKSMKHVALASALSDKFENKHIIVVDGFETLKLKTKLVALALNAVNAAGSILFAISNTEAHMKKTARNIARVDVIRAIDIHPYAVLTHTTIVITKVALEELKKHLL